MSQGQSIEAATASFGPGDTVHVNAGTYREQIDIDHKGGNATTHALLKAIGTVIIDCADPFSDSIWTVFNGDVYTAFRHPDLENSPNTGIWVDDTLCTHKPLVNYASLGRLEYRYDATTSLMYLNVGGGSPAARATYIGNDARKRGIEMMSSDYVTIDGFTILRAGEQGMHVRDTGSVVNTMRSITIKNSTVAHCRGVGIYLRYGSQLQVMNNITHHNQNHGILVFDSDSCVIAGNTSYENDDPNTFRGGKTGIRIGDKADPNSTTHVAVDGNVVYRNEDTGIDVRGASDVLFRRNISYANRDHGYDHAHANNIVHIGNLAYHNDHDGMSAENNVTNLALHNSMLIHNGRDHTTLQKYIDESGPADVRELFVANSTGFKSDHNVFEGLLGGVIETHAGYNYGRYLVSFTSGSEAKYHTVAAFASGSSTNDSSFQALPAFSDTANAVFSLATVDINVVDVGSALPEALSADVRGYVMHDVASATNRGNGSVAYMDIGPYEYDVPPDTVADLNSDITQGNSVSISWTAPGDDDRVGTAGLYDVRYVAWSTITEANWADAGQFISEPSPSGAASAESFVGDLPQPNTVYSIGMKTRDSDNSLWSALSNVTAVASGGCCTMDPVVAPRNELEGEGEVGRSEGEAVMATTEAVVLEMRGQGVDRKWDLYATQASEWINAETGTPPFILVQQPDRSGGWRLRAQYDYRAGALGVLAPYGDEGRIVLVGPRGQERVGTEVMARDGGTFRLEVALHSRLGDVTEDLGAERSEVDLRVGDTLRVNYVRNAQPSENVMGAFFTVLEEASANPTEAERLGRALPERFALAQSQPNPFATTTTIRFDLPRAVHVTLDVFDVQGRRVARLVNGVHEAGYHSVAWGRSSHDGPHLGPGVYLYCMQAGQYREERKVVLLP